MLINIMLVIAVAIAALLIYAATRPDTFRIERSATFKATPDKVFEQINDLHRWQAWSAWEYKDHDMQRTYGGTPSGVGATYAWAGNRNVGKGRMTITESIPNQKVQIKLDFLAPMEAHHMADLIITPEPDGARLSWAMYGTQPFIGKVFSVFMDMDKMVGKDFEDCLNNLRAVVEK